jgi:hypothetical protein
LSIHINPSHWWKFSDKTREHSFICGIGIEYPEYRKETKGKSFNFLKRRIDFVGQKGKIVHKFPKDPKDPKEARTQLYVNSVEVSYAEGLGRISGLTLFEGTRNRREPLQTLVFFEEDPKVQDSQKWWSEPIVHRGSDRLGFAGFFGAFEKVGPLGRDRVLAKIAIAWKNLTLD